MEWLKKQPQNSSGSTEEKIQDEIRRRILKEAKKKEAIKASRDKTEATLDALEEIVSLSREEMERIAEEVKAEFRDEKPTEKPIEKPTTPPKKKRSRGSQILWIASALVIMSFFGFRRGQAWMMIGSAVLLVILFNLISKLFEKDD